MMQKTLLSYVKPHVQEDPLAMILGLAYLGASVEKHGLPVELADERILTDQEMRAAIERNDIIVAINGAPVGLEAAVSTLRSLGRGTDSVSVEIIRKGPLRKAALELRSACQRRMASNGENTPSKPDDLTFAIFRPR